MSSPQPVVKQGSLRFALAGAVGGTLLDALMATTRIETINEEAYRTHHRAGQPVLFALWHGRLLPPTYLHRGQGIVTLASQSADGEYITRVLHRWKFHVVRGSSSRGGDTALRELVRLARAGRSIAITSDGPRGPRERLKFGVLHMAQLSGAPLVPVGSAASSAWWFESWDRFLVPRPFAKLRVAYGDAVFIPRDTDSDGLAAAARRIEDTIGRLTRVAEEPFA